MEMPLQTTQMDDNPLQSRNSVRSNDTGQLPQLYSPRDALNPTPTSPPSNSGLSRSMRMYDFISGRDKVYSFAQ
jgi:hypothetical protein